MDVEKLKKINMLAQDLLKHNFALDPSDAFKQAEQTYTDTPLAEVKKQPVEKIEQPPNENTELLEKRYQFMLDMNNRKFEAEITNIKQQINMLADELTKIKTARPPETNPANTTEKTEQKTETKPEHPRQGHYTPQDVAIDKMFYFGKK